ncbi:Non-lysosomal glucosylceramidase [Arachis hypogaea]|nr:Non-lysosomal glucosylceramidase [Arachis hypogaea]
MNASKNTNDGKKTLRNGKILFFRMSHYQNGASSHCLMNSTFLLLEEQFGLISLINEDSLIWLPDSPLPSSNMRNKSQDPSREIWTGVTYGVASTMILAGMEEEAFATADGIFQAGLVRRWIRVLVSDTRGMDNGWTLQVSHLHEVTFKLGYAICINIAQGNS